MLCKYSFKSSGKDCKYFLNSLIPLSLKKSPMLHLNNSGCFFQKKENADAKRPPKKTVFFKKVASRTPGTGDFKVGCWLPPLTRCTEIPCGETRHRAVNIPLKPQNPKRFMQTQCAKVVRVLRRKVKQTRWGHMNRV